MSGTRNSSLLGKITVLVIVGCCCCLSVQAKYGGGSGTPEDPYQIWDANHMQTIGGDANDWDKHFKLMADIDLSGFTGTSFNIIGTESRPFTGVFDGNGHTIYNFTYISTGKSYIGLFGYVRGSDAKIKNLGLIDPNVDAGTGRYVGLLVGRLRRGTIMNCYVEDGCVAGDRTVGGLVGENYISTVTNCYSSSSVTGTTLIGGLVGLNYSSAISNCCSKGIVSGSKEVGGLVGYNGGTIDNCFSSSSVTGSIKVGGLAGWNRDGTITNSYSTGSVSGTSRVGGLVGWNLDTITNCYSSSSVSGDERVGGLVGDHDWGGTIANCYSTGRVTGDRSIGGLVGYKGLDDEVFNSFWDIETSGQTASAGGTPKTTAEMQTVNTFILWVCPPVWTIDEGLDYPRLWWENKPGEPITKPSYGGGSGEPSDPYLIYTAEQLNTIGLIVCDLDKHFLLCADIDLSIYTGTSFNIIGTRQPWRPFSGVFDGNGHTISNFTYTSTGTDYIGLFGYVYVHDSDAQIKNLGLIDPNVDVGTGSVVGSLVGWLRDSTITNCYVDDGSVSGNSYVGGLVGTNDGTINNCYATGSVSGDNYLGGLAGNNRDTITNCYSAGSVSGVSNVGGLLGRNASYGQVMHSFWDIETSGQDWSAGGTGLPTAQMQIMSTFTDAGWDFNTPVWTIDEGVDYPRLWWEYVPLLHAEPEVTLGTSNTISWEPVVGDVEYYAECAEDTNFASIVYNSGWITETSCEFIGLQLGKRYWYSVKARNSAGVESQWSNVESSLQCTLADAVDIMLDPNHLKSGNLKKPYINKINIAQDMIDRGIYTGALSKLENDILPKTDGCAESGEPDKSDWIITCEEQAVVYPLIIETIEHVRSLIE